MQCIGKDHPSVDSRGLITGKHGYTDDYADPNALIIKVLRSIHAFANIVIIDFKEVDNLPCVGCIVNNQEFSL